MNRLVNYEDLQFRRVDQVLQTFTDFGPSASSLFPPIFVTAIFVKFHPLFCVVRSLLKLNYVHFEEFP